MAKLINRSLLVSEKSTLLSAHKKEIAEDHLQQANADDISIEHLLSEQKRMLDVEFAKRLTEAESKAFEAGMNNGLKEGKKEAFDALGNERITLLHSLKSTVEKLRDIQNEAIEYVNTLEDSCKQELLEIIFDSVVQIIGENFVLNSDSVNSIVLPLLMQFADNKRVHIKLSKVDYDFINLESNLDILGPLPNNLFFENQQGMEKSGLMLSSDEGELDLRLSTKLEQFKTLLIQHGDR